MKKYLKHLIYLLILIPVLAWADMIIIEDDDPFQYLTFENCFLDSTIGVIVYTGIYPDSMNMVDTLTVADTAKFYGYNLGYPDTDENDRKIAGHYHYEYWVFVNDIRPDSSEIANPDTNKVIVDYELTACGGLFHVD